MKQQPRKYYCLRNIQIILDQFFIYISNYRIVIVPSNNSTSFVPAACPNGNIGSSCSIASDPCSMAQPCLNMATCTLNATIPVGYYCVCVTGYTGTYCQIDARPCREGVNCLNGGVCNGSVCVCPTGKSGVYCQYQVDTCGNIKCENDGKCISSYGNWSCRCTNNDLYSGTYCEIKSSSLRTKEIITRSLTAVVIGCIATVMGFVILMDVLKYVFKIDPVHRKADQFKNKTSEKKKKTTKRKQPITAIRFRYIHA